MIVICMGVCGSGKTTIGLCLAKQVGWSFADADEFHSKQNKEKMAAGLPLNDQDRYPWLEAIHRHIASLSRQRMSGVVTCSALKRSYRDILRHGLPAEDRHALIDLERNTPNPERNTPDPEWNTPDPERNTLDPERNTPGSFNLKAKAASQEKVQTEMPPVTNETSKLTTAVNQKTDNKDSERLMDFILADDYNVNMEKDSFGAETCLDIQFVHLTGSREVLESRLGQRKGHFMPAALLQSQLDTLEILQEDEPGISVDIDNSIENITQEIVDRLHLIS